MHGSTLANLKIGSLSWDVTFNYTSQNRAPGNSCRNIYCCFLPAPNTHNKSLKTTNKNFLNSTNHTQATTITLLFKNKQKYYSTGHRYVLFLQAIGGKATFSFRDSATSQNLRVTDHMNNLQHQLRTEI